MILFHGSNIAIDVIDLSKSRPGKDFGKGFYLSADKQQAIEMAESKDLIYGPIANDKVGAQIRNFKNGSIDLDELVRRIKYLKGITFQYFFGTEAAIKTLKKL